MEISNILPDLASLGVTGTGAVFFGVFLWMVRKGFLTFVKDKQDVVNTTSSTELVTMLRDQVVHQREEIKDLQKAREAAIDEVKELKKKLVEYESHLLRISQELNDERGNHTSTKSQLSNVINRLDEIEGKIVYWPTIQPPPQIAG
jgi:septal ring factor EnvC (AmiA/AmiB activator)